MLARRKLLYTVNMVRACKLFEGRLVHAAALHHLHSVAILTRSACCNEQTLGCFHRFEGNLTHATCRSAEHGCVLCHSQLIEPWLTVAVAIVGLQRHMLLQSHASTALSNTHDMIITNSVSTNSWTTAQMVLKHV
jgi:hypothetical protein